MILFYSTRIDNNIVILSDDEHLHCTKVLRKKMGDVIECTDGKGHLYQCKILDISKSQTKCEILEHKYHSSPSPQFGIAISPTKNAVRLEWFIEKAVEIGISDIFIMNCHRTEKKSVNQQRIEKIIVSAMKQSLNIHLPNLTFVNHFDQLLDSIDESFSQKFIAHCDGPTQTLQQLSNRGQNTIVLIGPEGDFTKDEVDKAISHHFISVSLGNARLRTETAGLVALMSLHSCN